MKKLFHVGLELDGSIKYAIVPGDPGRVEKIAAYLDDSQFLESNREYTSWVGTLEGEQVLVTSTGIGGPSASICVEELVQGGVHTFIRVGTCGGMDMDVKAGDLIVPNGAIRMEGTTKEYVPIEYPAVPDFNILCALVENARDYADVHVGIVQSKDSFYGQHSPNSMPVGYELNSKWDAWKKAGALASEMECAALFTVASVRRVRAGAVLMCIWNQEREAVGINDDDHLDTTLAIQAAVGAMRKLIVADRG